MNPHGQPNPGRRVATVLAVALAWSTPVAAQAPAATVAPHYQPGQDLKPTNDPVVAIVDGRSLHLSELGDLARELPAKQRGVSFEQLYPALLDGLVDHTALELKARRLHVDDDPAVRRRMAEAAGRALEQALLDRIQEQQVTEDAIRQLYDQTFGGKTVVDALRLRIILLGSEADANQALARLRAGEDFAAVARDVSRDASGPRGGDIGLMRQDQLQPDLAAAAVSLKPQEIASAPVHTRAGWYIIRLEDRATAPPPTYDEVHDSLRERLVQDAIRKAVAQARAEASVQEFNIDGSSVTDQSGALLPYLPPKPDN